MHRSKAGRKILFRDCSRSFRIRPPSSAGNCYNGLMKRNFRSLFLIAILAAALCFFLGFSLGKNSPTADPVPTPVETPSQPQPTADEKIDEDGYYYSKEDVALYIETYGKLPDNFITKSEAKDLGYSASKENLWKVCEGCCIGGDRFGNREGILPNKSGRKYYECDIDFDGKDRGAKRIVFSNDGLIYYTDDHYTSFTLLYGEP